MILLGIDLETTGLNPEEGSIIELGAMLWDAEKKECLTSFSTLIKDNCTISYEIESLTGIGQSMIEQFGVPLDMAFKKLIMLVNQANYAVAHNCEFEKSWLSLAGLDFLIPWIDTRYDLPFKPGKGNGSLSEIAMSHGLFNPRPHRALPDVHVMMQLLSKYDFKEVERYALTPTEKLIIKFDYDATGEKNKLVKGLGYYWEAGKKYWYKSAKAFNVDAEKAKATEAGFSAQVAEKDE